jgi:GT2 family glycosyltransferase/glycosyltransferase involved in cell wall biosynthesis
MLTRLLHSCDLELGPESELMPAQSDNPDGFWENLRFVALNDEVLNELGGAWDLPPQANAAFKEARLDPLRMKARLLIDAFDPTNTWGWKDPRNCLTLPFWRDLLPSLKTLIIVRNPLEVAYSMRERNGTSYSFGLRLWEIYNRRLIAATSTQERIVTHYDFFFENPEAELRRIAGVVGLPSSKISDAAAIVAVKRRHTRFTTDQLIDARVSSKIVDLYRELVAEANRSNDGEDAAEHRESAKAGRSAKAKSASEEMLAGAVSRLNVSIPNAETVRRELAGLRGAKIEVENLQRELRRSAEELARRDGRITEMAVHAARQEQARVDLEKQLREASAARAPHEETNANLEKQLQEATRRHEAEIEKIRERFVQTNHLLHSKSISLAENEARVAELTSSLRRQLQATKKLSRLLDDLDEAAARLRSSRRWKMANPIAALKATLFPRRRLLGYGHLEKIISAYSKWQSAHPEVFEIDNAIQALASRATLPAAAFAATESSANEKPVRRFEPRAPTQPIEFTVHEQVEISIIIPVFNQCHFTQACLGSVQEQRGTERFEVIVVDDCSTDATADIVRQIPGIVYLRNETNLGFIASCNRGAQKARGEFLVFLNNDTTVTAGWLSALRETFEFEPRAGVVGSKLIFPDGRLQEAGGIIWRDGSGWNRGKFEDPEKPEYNFLREVDYCSAACLMIRKVLFESLGGFDTKYAPAYYEDTDLAFKVRRHRRKVLYQPLSEVIHYEGATGGTDLLSGTKKYQEVNRALFAEIWGGVLEQKPANGDVASYDKLKSGQKRILVIDHHLPMPDRDSGSLRMFQILRILHELGHRVTFVPDNVADIAPYADELQKRGIEVIYHPYIKNVREYLERHGPEFDVVILSRCDFARKHIVDVRLHAPQSRIIFDTVDLHFLREDREAELTQDATVEQSAREKQRQEYDLIDQADETWVVSPHEQELLRRDWPNKSIEVVSNIVDVPGSATPFSLRHDFLFIGSFQHTPNIDAVLFFTREIYPLVRQCLKEAKFYVIGDKAPPEVIALANENIVITGLQPDVRPYFESVKLSIAPLRFGAGVKGKINQSMGFGVPVVATSVAVEGMALTDREDVLIADTPEDFARALVDLYTSAELWNRLSANGIEKTKAMFSCEVAKKNLSRLFSDKHLQLFDAAPRDDEGVDRTHTFGLGSYTGSVR